MRRIEVIIESVTKNFEKGIGRSESTLAKFGKFALPVAGAAAAGLAVGLEKSVKAALDAQKSQARLGVAFKNAHLKMVPYEKSIEAAEMASRRLGFTDEDVKNSLGSLITATGSYRKSVKEMAVAQDLARFKSVSLAEATKALTMLHAGSTRALKQLGIATIKVTDAQDKVKEAFKKHSGAAYEAALADAKVQDKQATLQQTLEIVTQKVHGQADAYSKTASGAMEQFHAQLQHLEVTIGTALIPALTKALKKLNEMLIWFQTNWPKIKEVVIPILNAISFVIEHQLKSIYDMFKFWIDLIHGRWSKAWDDLKGVVMNITAPMRAAAEAVGRAVWNGFTGALDDGWKFVKKKLSELFGSVVDWVKHVLGISSPSTIFHDIGVNVIKGFVDGIGSMAGVLEKAVVALVKKYSVGLVGSLLGGGGTGAGGGLGSGYHASTEEAKKFAKFQSDAMGWSGRQFADLISLWNRESGWRWNARNPTSGAYGIPQALPPSKMGSVRSDWPDNAFTQIAWGLQYIAGRYGNPSRAWAHEQAVGWYGQGGIFTKPAIIGVGEQGPEAVIPLNQGTRGSPMQINLTLDGRTLASVLVDPLRSEAQIFKNRTGQSAFA